MVSTRKKKQSNRRLLNQLDDFDQDIILGNAATGTQENSVVKEGNNERDFTAGTSSNNSATNESTVNEKTLERCFNAKIDTKMTNIVETVENRKQNAFAAPIIELASRSINASSGQDATSVAANSECREHAGINSSFEITSENNNIQQVSNGDDETRNNNTF